MPSVFVCVYVCVHARVARSVRVYGGVTYVCTCSYSGCRQRNSLLVMHVTEDPDGAYARAVVNYLLSGAWPDVISTSVSLSAIADLRRAVTSLTLSSEPLG